jgi:hypothetical protein
MSYLAVYLNAIGSLTADDWIGMGLFLAAVAVVLVALDRFVLWHDKAMPWRGL